MSCGVHWGAIAARRPVPPQLPAPSSAPAAESPPWWKAGPLTQRLRIGFGAAGILVIGLYVLIDAPNGATGRQGEHAQASPAVRSDALAADAKSSDPASTNGPSNDDAPPAFSAGQGVPGAPVSTTASTSSPAAASVAATAPSFQASAATVATPLASPIPTTPLLTSVVLEGSGTQVTEPFKYPGGHVRVHSLASTSAGAGCVYIGTFHSSDAAALSTDVSLRTTVIFLEAPGTAEGWVELDLVAGSYYMEIESDCEWTVTVAPG